MKRFRFPLQPVMVLRAHLELRAREAFGLAVQAGQRAEAALGAARERTLQVERALAAGRSGTFSAATEVQMLTAHRQECVAETAAEQALLAARAVVEQRRVQYLETRRNVEILARLEQKARAAHRLDGSREEQAGFDDLAAGRFARRRSGFSV